MASETFRFKSPYKMADHGSSENGINWADWHIGNKELHTVFTEAVSGFSHLYNYGVSRVTFFSTLTGRTIHNIEEVDCPTPDAFNHKQCCNLPCHKLPKFACATKTAHNYYDCLMHYPPTKDYVQCPLDMTRYSAHFIAAV